MKLTIAIESWPVAGVFRIARREATATDVVVVELEADGFTGRGECGPNVRYDESARSVADQLEGVQSAIEAGTDREMVQTILPPGAARNALDCALWDLEAKQAGRSVWQLAGLAEPQPLTTAFTLSIDTPDALLTAAEAAADRPVLKVKMAGDEIDLTRLRAVRAASPDCTLIVDANESLTPGKLDFLLPHLMQLQVAVIEQPLPEGEDDILRGNSSPIPLCADESIHTRAELGDIAEKYQAVNIKLDKAGGLTEALALRDAARDRGLKIMVGCMLGTSLAMAPAALIAQGADWVDLDGPLLLAKDREPGLTYDGSTLMPPGSEVWG
ncbi:MAG: N-acetyl-D-Glu racemase DgcA [Alphaproteobacteria bacterium]